MVKRRVVVRNRAGLHTRPSAILVKSASGFEAEFFIDKDGFEVNGKSIIGVMTLAAEPESVLILSFEGKDEVVAADAICALFEDGFGEELLPPKPLQTAPLKPIS